MKCPNCGKELWETEETVFLTNKEEVNSQYQCPVKIYWCANGCSMDGGCGFSRVVFED